jgi:LasA protease
MGMFLAIIGAGLACTRTGAPQETNGVLPVDQTPLSTATASGSANDGQDPVPSPTADGLSATPSQVFPTPTMDPTHPFSTPTLGPGAYVVEGGDTIGSIAIRFGVTVDALVQLNGLANPDALAVGQPISIPVPPSEMPGPNFKIIPDSEMVFGPSGREFNIDEFLRGKSGYLSSYREVVEGIDRSGPEILQYVAWHYSVNPRLLLALLEYRSQWVSNPAPGEERVTYPILTLGDKPNLYKQLTWAADTLNSGYYGWKAGAVDYWYWADGRHVRIGPGINAGTAAIQNLMKEMYSGPDWEKAVSQDGFFATYQAMFGYPFAFAVDPITPPDLVQPVLILPFEPGVLWYFTGGPHGGWGTGSAWAALDFGPGDIDAGCLQSNDWVVASAPGLVVRSEEGAVVLDLDFDGNERTNWVLFYEHIETRDRVPVGTRLNTGDRIGHPSCEGSSYYTGTHFHIARRFNGEWIPADGPVPLVLDGWVASGTGVEYDGYLTRAGVTIEAKGWSAEDNILIR